MDIPHELLALSERHNKELNYDHIKFSLALDSSDVGIWSWNIPLNTLEGNNHLYELLGVSSRSDALSYQDFMQYVYAEDRGQVEEKIQEAVTKKSSLEINFRVLHPDLSLHYLNMRGKVYCGQADQPLWMTGICWDITTHRLEEEKLKQAKQHAEDSLHVKTNFVARVSHDLRSPLNGIIGFAELMYHGKVGGFMSNEQREYLGDILISARQLLLLINDVLDLSKIEAGKMEFHSEKIDFREMLEETTLIFQTMITDKKIQFETLLDDKLGEIVIDPIKLKQILYCYISNALKCTEDHGHVMVRVVCHDKENFRIEVEDDGIGVKEEDLKHLFVEFQQLDRKIAKKYSGTGLGLALTKYIVEALGGKVGVKSVFAKGSTFYAILPLNAGSS